MLEIRSLHKSHGEVVILDNVDLALRPGECTALVGESGSGKSTLLHLVAGLDAFETGHIRVGDVHVENLDDTARAALRRTGLALIFQQFNLISSLNVADNIAFQAQLSGRWSPKWGDRLIDVLGLRDLLKRYPEQVSGGQAQRVAIARALACRPGLILADEPTGNLDEATGDAVMALMLELVAESGAAMVFVTHSTRLAAQLPRIVTLRSGKLT